VKLKIYVLVDNTASHNCQAEHGLSYVISYDTNVIFDTGQTNLFIKNAEFLGFDLNNIETVILSHGHYDHGNGLQFIDNKVLICHPDVFLERFSGHQRKPVGLALSKDQLLQKFRITETREPYFISDRMVYLGEIPRKIKSENLSTSFYLANNQPDLIADDSGLAVIMDEGLFVISGCAHSGICNIIEHARKVTGISQVYGVIGGFHLKLNNRQTQQTIEYFKELNIQVVMPSHCTELPALSQFFDAFGGEQVKAGTLYTFGEE